MQSIPGESHTIGVNGLSCHGEMDLSETLRKSNSSRSSASPAPPLALTGGWVRAPASHCTVAGSNTQLWDRFSYVLAMHFLCINVLKHRSLHRNYLTLFPFLNILTYTIYESHAYILCSCQVQHALAKHVLSFYVSPLTSALPVYDKRKEDITSFYLLHCKTGEPKCVVLRNICKIMDQNLFVSLSC